MQITYNKRKRGLLKKLVELSVICGIQAKLEMRDSFGNLIVVDAGQKDELPKPEVPKERVFVFTQADVTTGVTQYPEFKGFERMRRRNQEQPELEPSQEKLPESRSDNSLEVGHSAEDRDQPRPQTPQSQSASKVIIPQAIHPIVQQPMLAHPEMPLQHPSMDYLCYMQNMHLRSQLDYAEMQYRSLMSQFMNGQL